MLVLFKDTDRGARCVCVSVFRPRVPLTLCSVKPKSNTDRSCTRPATFMLLNQTHPQHTQHAHTHTHIRHKTPRNRLVRRNPPLAASTLFSHLRTVSKTFRAHASSYLHKYQILDSLVVALSFGLVVTSPERATTRCPKRS